MCNVYYELFLTSAGCIPGVSFRSFYYAENDISLDNQADYGLKIIAFKAQISGGLVICVPEEVRLKIDRIVRRYPKEN